MSRSYTLNPDQAIAGSASGFQRITQSGAYTGVFTKVKRITAGTGAEGIEFTFKASNGQEANYLNIFTHNRSGEEIYGHAQLNALMACLKQRQIEPQVIQINEYNHAAGQDEMVQITAYPQLMNSPVGVVLQREEYLKKDGSVGEAMNLHAFFDPTTRQTGAEVIQQKPATAIDGVISSLKDKTLPSRPGTGRANVHPASTAAEQEVMSQGQPSQALKDFDDDIPF